MPERKGYRVDKLRRQRRRKVERRQAAVLYVLAAAVAFAAVLGAWYVTAKLWVGTGETERNAHLTLLTIAAADGARPTAAALAVKDVAAGRYTLFVIPRELLVYGPNGEYVFAEDSMAGGTLTEDLARVVESRIDAAYLLPANTLDQLVAADELDVPLAQPVTLVRDGREEAYEQSMTVKTSEIAEMFTLMGVDGQDSATVQEGLWGAALLEASRRPADVRAGLIEALALASTGTQDRWFLKDSLEGLTAGNGVVARLPSVPRVAEGQFAFVPDPAGVMAGITRKAGDFQPRVTVVVRNGSGEAGVGEAVVERLSVLDVRLPSPTNADEFGHRKTQIMAGAGALTVAEDIRAILGRGVVLNGADLSPDTVLVIIGDDLKAEDLEPKDTP